MARRLKSHRKKGRIEMKYAKEVNVTWKARKTRENSDKHQNTRKNTNLSHGKKRKAGRRRQQHVHIHAHTQQ